MKKLILFFALGIFLSFVGTLWLTVYAQKTVTFRAIINPGALLTDIRDSNGHSVAQPVIDFGRVVNSVDCRIKTGLSGELGSDSQRIYVDNPKAAFDGWTLTIAPKDGSKALWRGSKASDTFDINDGVNNGCSDGDGDRRGGLMTIDPSSAHIYTDCLECSKDHLFIGREAYQFSQTDAVTLLRATGDADDLGSWYLTGVNVKQTIPEGQEGDTYSIDMVLTATAR